MYPGEGFTQLWVCTLQWDEFASRGVFALQLEGMEGMSGTRRPPGRAALRSCLEAVPAAGCPAGAVCHAGHGVAVPVSQCYPGSLGKRAPHQWAPTRLTRVWVQGAHGAEIPECCDICRPASLTGNPSRKSLEAGRVFGRVQTCPARLLPGRLWGELGSLLGSPVLSPCRMSFSQQFCVPVCCRAVGVPGRGAEGCARHFSSPSGCLQWEHWFCTHFLLLWRIHPLH